MLKEDKHHITRYIIFCCIWLAGLSCAKQEQISFNQHIRPILNDKCLSCHGGVKKMGDFSLLFREEALDTTESGVFAIVPGNHRKSELYRRIVHSDPELRMPQEKDPLTQTEIDLIAKWIDQGAKWEEHWAFVPPRWPEMPKETAHPIDHFVQKRLAANDLEPAPPADKNTLIRRVSLDLTGLPPNWEEVQDFIADDSPEAYEKVVDRLLTSPHFGERWTAMWLDLARYADSKGYEKDSYRNIWRYRDWLIQAFNNDLPFDQFTIEQLAADLLPNPSDQQLLATAFNRNTMTNTEGGTDDEEYRTVAVMDRLNTTFEVWQSTTISCVQCHSHPYDPFRHEEYYELLAFFNNTQDADVDSEFPVLELYQESQAENIEEIISFLQTLEPNPDVNLEAPVARQIEQAIFPKLIPAHADDYHNLIPRGDGDFTNWTNNVQSGDNRRYLMKYDNIQIDNLESINVKYTSGGDDAILKVRLDDPDGPVIGELPLLKPAEVEPPSWPWTGHFATKTLPLQKNTGQHHLIFEVVNTTGKIPEGGMRLREFVLNYADQPKPSANWEEKTNELIAMRRRADYTPIMKPRSETFHRTTQIFERGNWMVKGAEVKPGVPGIFESIEAEDEATRLDLAQWMVSRENPLTARVFVNRLWEQLFGTGIIETLEDFGTQGLPPSHPELLEYLAMAFMHNHDWSVKGILKEIVLSETYQQSSSVSPEKLEQDPYNRLLARGPRFRLSAEQVRDQALK